GDTEPDGIATHPLPTRRKPASLRTKEMPSPAIDRVRSLAMPRHRVFLMASLWMIGVVQAAAVIAAPPDGTRPTSLDDVDPYYPHRDFPKLITPQWVGEPGVEAVVVLAIDDMRDPARYERYLRPILDRLKAIDGRAPVSIMTNQVNPKDPRLSAWL